MITPKQLSPIDSSTPPPLSLLPINNSNPITVDNRIIQLAKELGVSRNSADGQEYSEDDFVVQHLTPSYVAHYVKPYKAQAQVFGVLLTLITSVYNKHLQSSLPIVLLTAISVGLATAYIFDNSLTVKNDLEISIDFLKESYLSEHPEASQAEIFLFVKSEIEKKKLRHVLLEIDYINSNVEEYIRSPIETKLKAYKYAKDLLENRWEMIHFDIDVD